MPSTTCWSSDARTMYAPININRKRGWGLCVHPSDPCTTLA